MIVRCAVCKGEERVLGPDHDQAVALRKGESVTARCIGCYNNVGSDEKGLAPWNLIEIIPDGEGSDWANSWNALYSEDDLSEFGCTFIEHEPDEN